jgi:hypothetical protein
VKLIAATISNATGFVGGGFAPSLFLGAVLGNVYGQLLGNGGLHWPVAEPPAYAMVGMAAVLAGSARAPLTSLLLLFELTHDIRIVLPLMAAAGLSAALVERWQGLHDPGLLGADPREEERRARLASLPLAGAIDPDPPLVLPGNTAAAEALRRLIAHHSHSLIVSENGHAVGLVTLPDLERALAARCEASGSEGGQRSGERSSGSGWASGGVEEWKMRLIDCRRCDLVWLPLDSKLDQLEDQLRPNGLRQVPVFEIPPSMVGHLPHGLPNQGLPLGSLRGMASRDGMARALAGTYPFGSARDAIRASATGSD